MPVCAIKRNGGGSSTGVADQEGAGMQENTSLVVFCEVCNKEHYFHSETAERVVLMCAGLICGHCRQFSRFPEELKDVIMRERMW